MMVKLSGLTVRDGENPSGDIEIRMIGMRPGEKLYEELLIGDDPQPTKHPRIMRANEPFLPWQRLQAELTRLADAIECDGTDDLLALLRTLVPGYQREAGSSDLAEQDLAS
jgi:FlaA1/EpsC-like NDP-sugar epimerase